MAKKNKEETPKAEESLGKLVPKKPILVPNDVVDGIVQSWVRVKPEEWNEVYEDALFSFWKSKPEIDVDKLISQFFNKD